MLAARSLLAFQYCERDDQQRPTFRAEVGALLWAELIQVGRAFADAYSKK